jgi:hypothetical protein
VGNALLVVELVLFMDQLIVKMVIKLSSPPAPNRFLTGTVGFCQEHCPVYVFFFVFLSFS